MLRAQPREGWVEAADTKDAERLIAPNLDAGETVITCGNRAQLKNINGESRPEDFSDSVGASPATQSSSDAATDGLNLVAVLSCLKGKGMASLVVPTAAMIVIWLQVFTLLNLSWLLNDARMADIKDFDQNYALIPWGRNMSEKKILDVEHKHITSQSDRFCYDQKEGTDRINIYYAYYNCIFTNTMTYWDISTILLLTLALADKIGEAHQELTLEVVLASSILHEPEISALRRAATFGFLGLRCLQEALFLVISIVIVAGSKGTVEMVLNSLAISFFADLDNIAWKRLLMHIPSVQVLRKSLCKAAEKTYSGVIQTIERRNLQTVTFTAGCLTVYFACTIIYKNPTIFTKLTYEYTPAYDSNIASSILLVPSLVIWAVMTAHFGTLSNYALDHDAIGTNGTPGSSLVVFLHSVTISLCLLYAAIGIQEAGAGAQCAWRLNLGTCFLLFCPTLVMHVLVQLRLRQPSNRIAQVGLSSAAALLAAASTALALTNAFSKDPMDPLSKVIMEHAFTTCYCGYGAWWNYDYFCVNDCHNPDKGICTPDAVGNPDYEYPQAYYCPNLALENSDQFCST